MVRRSEDERGVDERVARGALALERALEWPGCEMVQLASERKVRDLERRLDHLKTEAGAVQLRQWWSCLVAGVGSPVARQKERDLKSPNA